jgi:hypothetical protein
MVLLLIHEGLRLGITKEEDIITITRAVITFKGGSLCLYRLG